MRRNETLYDMMIYYLDGLRAALEAGGERREETLQFWQFVTLQELEIYSDEELFSYEKNLRKALENKGTALDEEDVISLIHERDVETLMHPGKETFTQRFAKIIKRTLDGENISYRERRVGFDFLRIEMQDPSLFVNVIRPERSVVICRKGRPAVSVCVQDGNAGESKEIKRAVLEALNTEPKTPEMPGTGACGDILGGGVQNERFSKRKRYL